MPRQALIRPLMDIVIPVPMAPWVFAMFLKAVGSKMILTHYIMLLNVLLWNKDSISWVMSEWTKTILNGGGSPEIVIFQVLGKSGLFFPKLTNVTIHMNSTLNGNTRQITDTK